MRRGWFVAAIVIAIAAVVVAALAMRLSDDDGELSASDWAGAVCSELVDWRSSITALADVGSGELTPESLGDRLEEAQADTSELVSGLRDLGPPDLEGADELQAELEADADDLEAAFDELKQGAEEATEAGAGEFLQALQALAPQFQALLDAASQTVADLQDADVAEESQAELEQAFSDAPACQDLRSEG